MKILKRKREGFSLTEILISIGIFAIIVGSVGTFAIDSYKSLFNSRKRLEASLLIQEVNKALLLNKNEAWATISQISGGGAKHLSFANNRYVIANCASVEDVFSINFQVSNVYRDSNGNIVSSGGTLDVHSKSITMTVEWEDFFGNSNSVQNISYVNDWTSLKWNQTTQTEFNQGTVDVNSITTNNSGGEVQLASVLYADWCKPANTTYSYDISGQGNPNALSAIANDAVLGTGGNASGLPFANIGITNTEPPVLSLLGSSSGHKTNGIFRDISNPYAYLATDSNGAQVAILNISGTPTQVGQFDPGVNTNGVSVAVTGNVGYMSGTNAKLYNIDLSSKSGNRPALYKNADNTPRGLSLAGDGNKIVISGSYAYVATNSTTTQMQIIDISNSSNISVAGYVSISGGGNGKDIYIDATNNRAYLATSTSSGTANEVFVIDITTKTGAHSPIGGYDTSPMSPTGITVIPGENRAIVVGTSGTEYQVLNTQSTNPAYCGGLNIDLGVNGVVGVTHPNGNSYSYIITGDPSAEFKAIRGGPGGFGGVNGQGYGSAGTFISSAFDSGSTNTNYLSMDWSNTVPANTSIRLQIRTASSVAGLNTAVWVGPSGAGSYFTSNINDISGISSIQNNRYFQYQVLFSSDTISTPVFESINLYYQD